MAERTYGSFEDAEGMHGYTREDVEEMSHENRIRMMVDWFHAHFEDPAHRTPYESKEGGYQWIWGGPHSADEEIQDEFSDVVDFETMQEAVQQVERDGLFDWAPKERPGDYDDDYDDDNDTGLASGEIADGDAEWPPVIPVDETPLEEPEARQEVIRRLDRLEELIAPLVSQHGMMGHNRPPEEMEVEHPCSRDEWLALSQAVQSIREQTGANEPDEEKIASGAMTLGAVAKKLAGWLKVRAEKGIDAALVACGTAAGASAVVNVQSIVDSIGGVVQALSRWIESFPMPF